MGATDDVDAVAMGVAFVVAARGRDDLGVVMPGGGVLVGDTECPKRELGADDIAATSPWDDDDACEDEDEAKDVADAGIANASAYEVRDDVDELLLWPKPRGDVYVGEVARL